MDDGTAAQKNLTNVRITDGLLPNRDPPVFWLSSFDFPMIDNTRLSNGHRLAAILTAFNAIEVDGGLVEGAAQIAIIEFDEAYASVRDRPFFQDILEGLRECGER